MRRRNCHFVCERNLNSQIDSFRSNIYPAARVRENIAFYYSIYLCKFVTSQQSPAIQPSTYRAPHESRNEMKTMNKMKCKWKFLLPISLLHRTLLTNYRRWHLNHNHAILKFSVLINSLRALVWLPALSWNSFCMQANQKRQLVFHCVDRSVKGQRRSTWLRSMARKKNNKRIENNLIFVYTRNDI